MNIRERLKKPKFYLKGIATYLPPSAGRFLPQHQPQFRGLGIRKEDTPHKIAMDCYTSWMRTLITLDRKGAGNFFKSVAEIGPGDSLGVGLAAMLSGADHYLGLDTVSTAYNFNNEAIFEELVEIFKKRSPLLTREECPKQRPYLESYDFPAHILTDEKLKLFLDDSRLDKIRAAIRKKGDHMASDEISISYSVPWDSDEAIEKHAASIDLIMSFAALEHVDDVPRTYYAADRLLCRGGIMASSIDFKCHDTAGLRNGHLAYSDLEWKIIRGNSRFLINRWPHDWHITEMKKYFSIEHDDVYLHPNKNLATRKDLAKRFSKISDKEITIAEAFIIARKKG